MGALGDEVSLGSNSVQTRAANDPSVFTITEKCLKCESASKCFQEKAIVGVIPMIVKLQSSRRFGSSSSTQPRSQQPGRENFSLNKLLSGAALVVWYFDLHANINTGYKPFETQGRVKCVLPRLTFFTCKGKFTTALKATNHNLVNPRLPLVIPRPV